MKLVELVAKEKPINGLSNWQGIADRLGRSTAAVISRWCQMRTILMRPAGDVIALRRAIARATTSLVEARTRYTVAVAVSILRRVPATDGSIPMTLPVAVLGQREEGVS